MTTLMSEKTKGRKRYSSKVKTGCLTCKIRRVKCDEERPFCRRCTSTGRKCDGYALQEKPSQDIIVAKSLSLTRTGASLTKITGTTEESRSLEFYFERAAPRISGLLGKEFWFRLVFQIGYSEKAVRHALIAIGYLFEKEGRAHTSEYHRLPVYGQDEFLFYQYNRAIGALVERMSGRSDSLDISVVTCVLFMCLESLMQRPFACLVHYHSGLKILNSMRGQNVITSLATMRFQTNVEKSTVSSANIAPKGPKTEFVDEVLVPLFTRLSLSASLHGADQSHILFVENAPLRSLPVTFASVEESWHILVDIMNQALKYIRLCTDKKYTQSLTPEDLLVHSDLLLCMDRWLQSLKTYERINCKIYTRDTLLCIFRMFHICTWVWLSCCNDPLDMEYDKYITGFQQLLSFAEIVANDSSAPRSTPELDFSYDMEFVAPIYFVACKCRDPVVRRKALSLLANRKRREGLWDSDRCWAGAKRLMAIEESGLCGSLVRKYPPAKYRIHDATAAVDGPHFRITYFTLPDGLGSPRYAWDEILWV